MKRLDRTGLLNTRENDMIRWVTTEQRCMRSCSASSKAFVCSCRHCSDSAEPETVGELLRLVLLAGRDGEQRGFGGRRDLDCRVPRVRWLRTPLRGKAEAQGTRPSKPEKKGTRPIGNSRGIVVRVGRLLSGLGKVLDTFLCPLHESGLVEGERM